MLEELIGSVVISVFNKSNKFTDWYINNCIDLYEKYNDPKVLESPIQTLEKLLVNEKLNSLYGYFYHYQLGRCHLTIRNFPESLDHYEQAVLEYPFPLEDRSFPIYIGGYLTAVRTIVQQEGIPNLHTPEGRGWLIKAGDSAMRVHIKYPSLQEVTHEAFTTRDWLKQTPKPKPRVPLC